MKLMTLQMAADQMMVSQSLVYKLSRAAEYAAELKAGIRRYEDVPASITPYLDAGFPRPKIIGKGIRRIRADELERWLN